MIKSENLNKNKFDDLLTMQIPKNSDLNGIQIV